MCHTFAEGRGEAAAGFPSGPHREVGLWRRHLWGRKDRTPGCLAPPGPSGKQIEKMWKNVKRSRSCVNCDVHHQCHQCSRNIKKRYLQIYMFLFFWRKSHKPHARCTQASVQQWRLTVTTKAQVQGYDGCGDQTLSVGKKKVWACLGYPAITN